MENVGKKSMMENDGKMLVNVSIKFMMANDGNAKRTPRKALQKVDKYLTAPQHGKKLYHDISEALKRCNKIKKQGKHPCT